MPVRTPRQETSTRPRARARRPVVWIVQLIGIGALIALVFWLYADRLSVSDFAPLFGSPFFVLAASMYLGGLTLQALLLGTVLGNARGRLPVSEAVLVTLASSFLNYIPGKPGLFFKVGFLRSARGIPIALSAACLAHAQILLFASAGAIGILGISLLAVATEVESRWLYLLPLLCGMLLLPELLQRVASNPTATAFFGAALRRVAGREEAYEEASGGRLITPALATLALASIAAGVFRLLLVATLVGAELSLGGAMLLQSVATASFVISLLPGNLGVREGAIVAIAITFGWESRLAVFFALADRLAAVPVVFVLGPIATLLSWRRFGRHCDSAQT